MQPIPEPPFRCLNVSHQAEKARPAKGFGVRHGPATARFAAARVSPAPGSPAQAAARAAAHLPCACRRCGAAAARLSWLSMLSDLFADIPSDLAFYAVAVPAVILLGMTKTLFGGGFGALIVPMLALVTSPVQAAAIQLPLLVAMDVFAVRAYWGKWDRRGLFMMLPGIPLGLAAGAATFSLLEADGVRFVLGVITLAFALNYWRHRLLTGNTTGGAPLSRTTVGGLAAMAAYSSFVAHAGSPPAQMAMLRHGLGKTAFVATLVGFFAATNYAKLGVYAALGLFSLPNLATSAVLAPLIPLGLWLGIVLHARIPQDPFFKALYVALLFIGAKLVWDGAALFWS